MTTKSIAQTNMHFAHIIYPSPFFHPEPTLDLKPEILGLLDEILSLNGRAADFTENTALLGAIPELDSMAVVALITGMEERFGFSVDDDEIDGAAFATVGTLIAFVEQKLSA